jgi:hypothetical protein
MFIFKSRYEEELKAKDDYAQALEEIYKKRVEQLQEHLERQSDNEWKYRDLYYNALKFNAENENKLKFAKKKLKFVLNTLYKKEK